MYFFGQSNPFAQAGGYGFNPGALQGAYGQGFANPQNLPSTRFANPLVNPSLPTGGGGGGSTLGGSGAPPMISPPQTSGGLAPWRPQGGGSSINPGGVWDNFPGARTFANGSGDSYYRGGGAGGILGALQGYGSGAFGSQPMPTRLGAPRNYNTPMGPMGGPLGNNYQPRYSPFGMNPFASQADSWGMLGSNPYVGRMNSMAGGMGRTNAYGGPWNSSQAVPFSRWDWFSGQSPYDASNNPFNNMPGNPNVLFPPGGPANANEIMASLGYYQLDQDGVPIPGSGSGAAGGQLENTLTAWANANPEIIEEQRRQAEERRRQQSGVGGWQSEANNG